MGEVSWPIPMIFDFAKDFGGHVWILSNWVKNLLLAVTLIAPLLR